MVDDRLEAAGLGDSVYVVGAGAIGMCMAAAIATAGRVPTLVSGWAEHVMALNSGGLVVVDDEGTETVHAVRAVGLESVRGASSAQVAYLAVKSQATAEYAAQLKDILNGSACVVSLQNGLNEYVLAEVLGRERVLGAVSPISAQRTGPGTVRVTGASRSFVIGEMDRSKSARVDEIARLSDQLPWRTVVSDNIEGALWAKLSNNTRLNTLCALSGEPLGATVRDPFFLALMMRIIAETKAVADAVGITMEAIPGLDVPELMRTVEAAPTRAQQLLLEHADKFPEAKPSMLQDLEAGKPTEINHLAGELLRHASRLGLEVPVLALAADGVRRLETSGADRRAEVLDQLALNAATVLGALPPRGGTIAGWGSSSLTAKDQNT